MAFSQQRRFRSAAPLGRFITRPRIAVAPFQAAVLGSFQTYLEMLSSLDCTLGRTAQETAYGYRHLLS